MRNTFGDPERGDATSRLDKIVEDTSRKFVQLVTQGSQVLNRPMGSQVLSPKDQVEEYMAVRGNPDAYAQIHQQYVNQHGFIKGTNEYAKWVIKMEAKVNGNA